MRIIAITNQKGGCGKTTTAVNLSASLAKNGKRVLLIDLDPQSHATLGLNIDAKSSMYDVLSRLSKERVALSDIIVNIDTDFDMAPSSIVLSTLEQELAGEIGRESRLCDTLSGFSGYDYILIDCPPNLGILTINAIRAADEIIIPVEASRFSFEGLSQLISIIELVNQRLNHNVTYQILITSFDSRLRHSFAMLDKIKLGYPEKLFSTIIHINVKLKEAQNQGTHIFSYDKYCRGAKDYYSLSREMLTEHTLSNNMPILKERMQEILKEKLPLLSEVAFSFTAPDAESVYLVGDFNEWKMDDDSRMQADNGVWRKRVRLGSGSYRYRFVKDGAWVEDPANPERTMNPYGQMDSLLKV